MGRIGIMAQDIIPMSFVREGSPWKLVVGRRKGNDRTK